MNVLGSNSFCMKQTSGSKVVLNLGTYKYRVIWRCTRKLAIIAMYVGNMDWHEEINPWSTSLPIMVVVVEGWLLNNCPMPVNLASIYSYIVTGPGPNHGIGHLLSGDLSSGDNVL